MARWKHDRVTKHEGVHAIVCLLVGLGAVVLVVARVGPQPAGVVITSCVALGFLELGVHYASVWRKKNSGE